MKKLFLVLALCFLSFHAEAQQIVSPCVKTSGGCNPVTSSNPLPVTAIGGVTVTLGTSVTAANPKISGDATSGFYTSAASKVDVTIGGSKIVEWSSSGEAITGALTATTFNGVIIPSTTDTAALLGTQQTFTKTQSVAPSTVSISTATFTPVFANSNTFQLTLVHASCPCTLANPSGTIVPGTDLIIEVKQSSSGSDLINTYGSFYKFPGGTAPTLSTAASATDMLICHVSDATHFFCGFASNFAQ